MFGHRKKRIQHANDIVPYHANGSHHDVAKTTALRRQTWTRPRYRGRSPIRDAAGMGRWTGRETITRESHAMNASYASPGMRDRFLGALAADDRTLSVELARNL